MLLAARVILIGSCTVKKEKSMAAKRSSETRVRDAMASLIGQGELGTSVEHERRHGGAQYSRASDQRDGRPWPDRAIHELQGQLGGDVVIASSDAVPAPSVVTREDGADGQSHM